ncbi:hypothetical protein [Nocardia wallacei]|uniref:hypothetical protein n=1 Tax=Nocardia wallacei TaxID=480035 RepID=UPI002458E92D|nr:hypothetical protein [Nocardia wallacei]
MRETLYSKALPRVALATASRTANAAVNGAAIDLEQFGNRFSTVLFIVQAGTVTDGSTAVTLQESADNSSWTTVAADHRQGSLPTITDTDDDKVFSVGYVPHGLRYVRIVATQSGATAGAVLGAVALCAGGGEPVKRS